MALAHEVGNQGMHAGGGEQNRGVVFGDEGSALDVGVALLDEEVDVSLLQLLCGHFLHCVTPYISLWL